MNLDIKDIQAKIVPLINKLRKYFGFIVILIMLGLFGFVVNQIRTYATAEPSEDAIIESLPSTGAVKIDSETASTIQKLESSNIDVETLFNEARDNPFQE